MIPVFRLEFGEEEKKLLSEVVDSGYITEGSKTQEFESLLKEYLNGAYVVVLPNGGVSLYLALLAVGVRAGDAVVCPDYCHISLPNSVTMIGARPVFIDIDYADGFMRWQNIPYVFSDKVKCVTTVDMNGRYCDYEAVRDIVEGKCPVIQDSCQALPSTFEGEHLYSEIGCLSFHPTKILACGGGAIYTNDVDIYREVKKMKDYGRFVERVSS